MKHQQGSTLVVSLILLTIITLVAVYALEGSSIQSKMVANSLFSTLTYQECRNEQEAEVRFFNENGGANRSLLITAMANDALYQLPDTITEAYTKTPKSELSASWAYIADAPAARTGYNIDIESPSKAYIFEGDCTAVYRFSSNDQTLGAVVEGLQQAGNIK
jgi:Tfp pilus assembly protein PilX